METKICGRCKKILNITNFHKHRQTKSGLASSCKDCVKQRHKKYYDNPINRDKQIQRMRIYNVRPDVKNRHKEWSKKYREIPANKERLKKIARIYYARPEIKKKTIEYARQYASRIENKQRRKEWDKMDRKNNPEKVRLFAKIKDGKRRAACKDTDITSKFLRDLWNRTDVCPLCGLQMEDNTSWPWGRHLEHILPLKSKDKNIPNGTHTKDNVQYTHSICNLSKHCQILQKFSPKKILEIQTRYLHLYHRGCTTP